jgi:hypothetical protein
MRRSMLAVTASLLFVAPVLAQHAGFTLIGDPSQAGKDLPMERRAVAPISAPYYHEDSFVTNDLRAWYVYHSFPNSIALAGGDAHVYALQARLAITNQLQLVAYKDGYVDFDSGLIQDSGMNDLAAGLKWNFWQDWDNDFHAAVGVGYQFAFGDPSVLQNDQDLRLWASVNKGFGKFHLGATLNGLFHTGQQDALGSSDRLTWHLHADYFINKFISPVVEFNGYHSINDGNEVLPFSGADVANLGGGDLLITIAPGFEVRPLPDKADLGFRVAFETPLSNETDLYGYRWTFSLVWRF